MKTRRNGKRNDAVEFVQIILVPQLWIASSAAPNVGSTDSLYRLGCIGTFSPFVSPCRPTVRVRPWIATN